MNPVEWLANSLIDSFFACVPQPQPAPDKLHRVKLVAHRGVHENGIAKENSLKALQLCIENKIWAAEFDVRFTKDDVPVVAHDDDCGRVFKRPDLKISQTTFAFLKREIPELATLAEVISQCSQKLHLMIEVKEDLRAHPERLKFLRNALITLTPGQDYHLLALNPDLLESLTFAPKSAFVDVIWLDAAQVLQKNHALGHGGVAGHFLFIGSKTRHNLHLEKRQVGVGFIRSKNSLYREVNAGADWIFTNHPLTLNKYLPHDT